MNAGKAAQKGRPTATNATAKQRANHTATDRQVPSGNAVATAVRVTARTGGPALVVGPPLPGLCPCERHLAQTKVLREVVVRRTTCGRGTIALRVALGAVAA